MTAQPAPLCSDSLDGARADAPTAFTDKELAEACRRGESQAMEWLYHRYKRRVFAVVGRIVGPQDAEEVSQEAFVRVFRGIHTFRGDSQLSTWIYRLSVNAALTYLKRRQRRTPAVATTAVDEIAAAPAPWRDPSLALHLEDALAKLPVGYRTVLVLHDVEGLSHEECAQILGCRIGTSKSQLHKARGRMRALLRPVLGLASEEA